MLLIVGTVAAFVYLLDVRPALVSVTRVADLAPVQSPPARESCAAMMNRAKSTCVTPARLAAS